MLVVDAARLRSPTLLQEIRLLTHHDHRQGTQLHIVLVVADDRT